MCGFIGQIKIEWQLFEKQVFHRRMRGSIWNDLQDPFSFEKRNDKLLSLVNFKKIFLSYESIPEPDQKS